MSGRGRRCALGAALALLPAAARAHLVSTGLGPVYDGIGHLALTPDDLLTVVALGLLGGLSGPAAGRGALFALPGAWLAGGLAGLAWPAGGPGAAVAWGALLVLGVLVAVDRRAGPVPTAAVAGALGLLHGYLDGAGLARSGAGAPALAGIAGATFVLVGLVAALAVVAGRGGARIALRVGGSWIAAIALLALGWALRARS